MVLGRLGMRGASVEDLRRGDLAGVSRGGNGAPLCLFTFRRFAPSPLPWHKSAKLPVPPCYKPRAMQTTQKVVQGFHGWARGVSRAELRPGTAAHWGAAGTRVAAGSLEGTSQTIAHRTRNNSQAHGVNHGCSAAQIHYSGTTPDAHPPPGRIYQGGPCGA